MATKSKDKARIHREQKTLRCECGRESYLVSSDCTKVTCWRCFQVDRAAKMSDAAIKKESLKVENVDEKTKTKPETKKTVQKRVNPIDPVTGKKKRGRPPKTQKNQESQNV